MKKLINLLWAQEGTATLNFHLGIFVLRYITGLAFWTVYEKFLPREGVWGPQEWFITDVAAMGLPLPELFAWIAVSIEFIGGIFLMLGFLSRPMAILNAMVMATAAFIHHGGDISSKGIMPFIFLIMCLTLAFSGGGKFSLDFLIKRKTNRV